MELTRHAVAYAIIALAVIGAIPLVALTMRRRRRNKLRRRGIKRYGH